MICLTADLHHMALGTGNQRHSDITELQTAKLLLDLLEPRGIKITFFVTGRSFVDEWPDLEPLCGHELVEIGGHNYDAFAPALPHRIWNKLAKNYNGPPAMQRRDIRRTIAVIEEKTGARIRSWRNHMYMHGPNTERLLAEQDIWICSDGVKRYSAGPIKHPAGIYNLPLNVMPDHEHLYHAERTPEWVSHWQARYNWSDDYGPHSYYINDWAEHVIAEIGEHERKRMLSTMIVHPITMYLADRMHALERILDRIASAETVFMRDVAEAARDGRIATDTAKENL